MSRSSIISLHNNLPIFLNSLNKIIDFRDGPEWLDARSKLNPIMMKPKVVKQYLGPIEEITNSFIKKINQLRQLSPKSEMPNDFGMEINKYTLESVFRMTMDKSLGSKNFHNLYIFYKICIL